MASDLKTTRKKDWMKLRRKMDGDDSFMNSHQIKKIRTMEREIPTWTLNDKEVRVVLLRAFPNLHKDRAAAKQAGRWTRLIHLYYRVQMSNSQVAKEMGEGLNRTKMTLKSIRRVARGRRADNTKIRSLNRPGRPKRLNK